MSAELFNDAMQVAREALLHHNEIEFQSALARAQAEVSEHPAVEQYLEQASTSYPSAECLVSLSAACMLIAHIEFNGQVSLSRDEAIQARVQEVCKRALAVSARDKNLRASMLAGRPPSAPAHLSEELKQEFLLTYQRAARACAETEVIVKMSRKEQRRRLEESGNAEKSAFQAA
jgi:hypothetical protein